MPLTTRRRTSRCPQCSICTRAARSPWRCLVRELSVLLFLSRFLFFRISKSRSKKEEPRCYSFFFISRARAPPAFMFLFSSSLLAGSSRALLLLLALFLLFLKKIIIGCAEVSRDGSVNVSSFPGRAPGCGERFRFAFVIACAKRRGRERERKAKGRFGFPLLPRRLRNENFTLISLSPPKNKLARRTSANTKGVLSISANRRGR